MNESLVGLLDSQKECKMSVSLYLIYFPDPGTSILNPSTLSLDTND